MVEDCSRLWRPCAVSCLLACDRPGKPLKSRHGSPQAAGRAQRPRPDPRRSGRAHRARIASHLLALDDDDRYLRFGYRATDEQIQRYVDGLDFDRDDIFGIYNRKLELIAMAHLAFLPHEPEHPPCAEFGVSVLKKARGRGYGVAPVRARRRCTRATKAWSCCSSTRCPRTPR